MDRIRVVGQLEHRCSMSVIAVAVHDADGAAHGSADGDAHADGAAHGSADGDAHRDPVVRANGCALVWADIPAFGYSRDLRADGRGDRGAELRTIERAYISADGRGDRGAELRDVGPHDCAAKLRTVEIAHSGALDAADARAEL